MALQIASKLFEIPKMYFEMRVNESKEQMDLLKFKHLSEMNRRVMDKLSVMEGKLDEIRLFSRIDSLNLSDEIKRMYKGIIIMCDVRSYVLMELLTDASIYNEWLMGQLNLRGDRFIAFLMHILGGYTSLNDEDQFSSMYDPKEDIFFLFYYHGKTMVVTDEIVEVPGIRHALQPGMDPEECTHINSDVITEDTTIVSLFDKQVMVNGRKNWKKSDEISPRMLSGVIQYCLNRSTIFPAKSALYAGLNKRRGVDRIESFGDLYEFRGSLDKVSTMGSRKIKSFGYKFMS